MDQNTRLSVLDISDPENAAVIANSPQLLNTYSTLVSGDRVYFSGRDGNLQVYSWSRDGFEKIASKAFRVDVLYVAFADGALFLGRQHDFAKLSLADEKNPTEVGTGTLDRGKDDHGQVTPMGNLIYIGNDHGTGSAFFGHAAGQDRTPPAVLKVSICRCYLDSLHEVHPSPHRNPDGTFTAAARRGRRVFLAAGCQACHLGPDFTDSPSGRLHDVGTILPSSGKLQVLRAGDLIRRGAFTASLTCIPDRRPPVLTFRSFDTQHPFGPHAAYTSEPLTRGTTALLQASGSPAVPLESVPASLAYPVSFENRDRALTFGKTYALVMDPPATDLAGNRATGPFPGVTTVADPGVLAEDGFEGPLHALTTTARVFTDTEFVVIGGKRALVFPPTTPLAMAAAPRFTARLRVEAGESRLRLTARPFGLPNFSASPIALRVAAPGASIAQRNLPELGMTSSVPASRLGVGSLTVELGAATSFEIPLPAGVTNEVMVDIAVTTGCGLRPSTLGYIIDDVRVE